MLDLVDIFLRCSSAQAHCLMRNRGANVGCSPANAIHDIFEGLADKFPYLARSVDKFLTASINGL